ncbi:hypothetical protein [Spirosoma sordidisoli]|uniref:DNA-binding protein n=1 Tax=Spirosoma sordidisoli TaxID=2502893 RepID=A0A4Q2UNC4_9BACT|nr:hypothetical protein [Spirosoma sordidisoli]RYC70826.1 hypothetical protein EQG79_01360 [Spirosoma sordidisoli]
MTYVPSYEEFNKLREEFQVLRQENEFLRKLFLSQRTVTRSQARLMLGVSETTLWRLTQKQTIEVVSDGGKEKITLESVRVYLTAQKKLSTQDANGRIIEVLHTVC